MSQVVNNKDVKSYKRAPLVELVIEIRWPVKAEEAPDLPPIIYDKTTVFDRWFSSFSQKIHDLGFSNIERLVPHGAPTLAYQPVFLYKKNTEGRFPAIQFGHGVLTINAAPDVYISWGTFRLEVLSIIESLVNSKPKDNETINFFDLTSIRYVNAFNEEFKRGVSDFNFIKDELKSFIQLPKEVFEGLEDENSIAPLMAINFPLKGEKGSFFVLQIASAVVGEEPATVMEMACGLQGKIPLSKKDVISVLDASHGYIRSVFDTMTSNVRDRMEPVYDD